MYVAEGNMETKERYASLRTELGFSLVEALIAMLITLVILSAAFGAFKSMADVNTASVYSIEVTQNLQSSLTVIRRDLQRTGQEVPDTGIPVPAGTTYTNDHIFGLEPGENSISVLYMIYSGTNTATLQPNGVNGTILSVADADFGRISNGDFIQLTTFGGTNDWMTTQRVTALNPDTKEVLFQSAVTDGGTRINRISTDAAIAPFIGATDISFIVYRRITYSKTNIDGIPWLMRQVNENAATRMTPGISKFNLTYEAASNADNSLSAFTVPGDFNHFKDIRMVHIEMVCLSDEAIANGSCDYNMSTGSHDGACASNGVNTDMAIRRYRNRFTSIPD